jgi:hypothetical protein
MIKHIGYIFWGLLLVILDFRLNQFDVLPDFVGYILVALGCGGLVTASSKFTIARNSCWALLVLSLVELIVTGDLRAILAIIQLAVNCTMMWFLLGGFMDLSLSIGRPDLAGKAGNRRMVYVALTCVASLLGFVAQQTRDISTMAIIVIVVAMVVLVVMILHLIHQIKSVLIENSNMVVH